MGRLWLDYSLDLLVMVAFAADNSSFGIIEHDWAIVSSAIAGGVTFHPYLSDETVPPAHQKLSDFERKSKEVELFDCHLERLAQLYKPVKTTGHLCFSPYFEGSSHQV